jgi:WD40 repeat protein
MNTKKRQTSGNVNTGTSSDPVLLATAGYDHQIRFWQAHSGVCYRTVPHQDSVSYFIFIHLISDEKAFCMTE